MREYGVSSVILYENRSVTTPFKRRAGSKTSSFSLVEISTILVSLATDHSKLRTLMIGDKQ